jgi:hypothetical protein
LDLARNLGLDVSNEFGRVVLALEARNGTRRLRVTDRGTDTTSTLDALELSILAQLTRRELHEAILNEFLLS